MNCPFYLKERHHGIERPLSVGGKSLEIHV